MPFDRESDGGVAEDAEVVAVVRVLRNPLPRKHQVFSEGLLQPSVEFISKAGTQWIVRGRRTDQKRIQDSIAASDTGKYQIFVERRFQCASIGNAKNGIGFLDIVSDPNARLSLPCRGDSIVKIATQPQVQ